MPKYCLLCLKVSCKIYSKCVYFRYCITHLGSGVDMFMTIPIIILIVVFSIVGRFNPFPAFSLGHTFNNSTTTFNFQCSQSAFCKRIVLQIFLSKLSCISMSICIHFMPHVPSLGLMFLLFLIKMFATHLKPKRRAAERRVGRVSGHRQVLMMAVMMID